MLSGLVLEVVDFASPWRWRWRLLDDAGLFVADHEVELDPGRWEVEAFRDLYGYLRWRVAPDQRLTREAEIVAEVGDWVGSVVLGPVGLAMAQRRRPVRLVLPAGAGAVGLLPWEMARVDGQVLAGHRVSVVVDQQPRQKLGKVPVGDRLRMLAIFSLPAGAGALNLRKERFELARLVNNLAKVNNKAVELRVVQYGVTRARLEEVLLEAEGWDVVHLSGHGLRGGLVLETETGGHDLIPSDELVDLLEMAVDKVKLVTLSACESAAVTAKEQLHLLGLDQDPADGDPAAEGEPPPGVPVVLSSVAAALVERLDCAVLAMRFPVADYFSIALARSFYDLVLGKGQPVDRALALTVPRVIPPAPTTSVPAVSVATPALFGGAALGLYLVPPPGQPQVFDLERQQMAAFPPQPKRFVGRVGALARAATVLAPGSEKSGLVFHGMAGGGKTTCALELAYTHQNSFQGLVWWTAPAEGEDIATALIGFGLALEQQLRDFKIVHDLATAESVRQVLPKLTELMEQERLLVVVDNAESLLTDAGGWRDPSWALLVGALTAHNGLSRLVITTRRTPLDLNAAVRVEGVHALTLPESMLLARDLPNLARLLDGKDLPAGLSAPQARVLVARTLKVVQGHPKLVELANGIATDPTELAARLDDADGTWAEHGTQLDTFLTRGEADADDGDYAAVLHGWTTTATTHLDDTTRLFFQYLACIEPHDRLPSVVDANWPDLWNRLNRAGDSPQPVTLLPELVGQGLVETVTNPDTGEVVEYRIHPGVADAARDTTGPDLVAKVDEELANYWTANLHRALVDEPEGKGWLVVHAAQSAAPYLLRRHRWHDLDWACESLLERDYRAAAVGLVLPMLTTALQTNQDPKVSLDLGRTFARALERVNPEQAESKYRALLDTAVQGGYFANASGIAGNLRYLYLVQGRLDEALTLADQTIEHIRRAGYGPWSQLLAQNGRLAIRNRQGHPQEVLEAGLQLLKQMASLPDALGPADGTVAIWKVREDVLQLLQSVTSDLGNHEHALTLNAEILGAQRRRNVTDLEQAQTILRNFGPLFRLGRLHQARELLIDCRRVFETANYISALGSTLDGLALVENDLGHCPQAVELGRDALRYRYLTNEPEPIAGSHHNLATYLQRDNLDLHKAAAVAHKTAAALIQQLMGSRHVADTLTDLGSLLKACPDATPASIDEVCAIVDQVDGVHLQSLLDRLPKPADPKNLLYDTLQAAMQAAFQHDAAERRVNLVESWDPVLAALNVTVNGSDHHKEVALRLLGAALDWREDQGWGALVPVLRRVQAGERDRDSLTTDLEQVDAAITHRALDLLAGGDLNIDPDSWEQLVDAEQEDTVGDALRQLVAAAGDDLEARERIVPLLQQYKYDTDPQNQVLGDTLVRVIAGEREPALEGLNAENAKFVRRLLTALDQTPCAEGSTE